MLAAQSLPHAPATLVRGSAGVESASLQRLGVWRGADWQSALAQEQSTQQVVASGHAPLDAELPGGGWPVGAMSEILLPATAHPEWALIGKALVQALNGGGGVGGTLQRAVLVSPPMEVFTPVMAHMGIAVQQLCCIQPDSMTYRAQYGCKDSRANNASRIWVTEQALKCRDASAVLAWLPDAESQALRRLQLLAAQQRRLLWVFRPERVRTQSSPAPLRLSVAVQGQSLRVQIIKRRGPPMTKTLELPLLNAALQAELAAQAWRKARNLADAEQRLGRLQSPSQVTPQEVSRVLDGMAFTAR